MSSNMTTLCYIEQDNRYLMLHRVKKENDINRDKWIGIGGHFEPNESPEECLLREVFEETGLKLTEYRLRGIITFISDKWQTEYMFLYTADSYEGDIGECDEGNLEWVDKAAVYQLPIWEGDKIFFRLLERNEPFFSLKLRYEGENLVESVLNGEILWKNEKVRRNLIMEFGVFFKSIIDQDRSSVVICNLEHEILYMNPASITNYAKWGGEKLIGQSLLNCHNPESREKIARVLEWFKASKENHLVYTAYNEKQNKDIYMVALRDNGELVGYYEKHEYRDRETMKMYDLD